MITKYTTPPADILEAVAVEQLHQIPRRDDLARICADFLGCEVSAVGVLVSAQLVKYSFNLGDISKILKIKKLVSVLAAVLHLPPKYIILEEYSPEQQAHFTITLPKQNINTIYLSNIINCKQFTESAPVSALLGLDIENKPIIINFLKNPHVLIAGASGAGKSVAVDSVLSSLIYKATPHQLKLIIIDPKQVSFTNYNNIPHLLTPIIKDAREALKALKQAINLMNARYKEFDSLGIKDISQTNKSHVIIIIDELADLMLSSYKKDIDISIQNIAQKGRAAGIHLLIATQQPTVKILTTTIKANITTRIALKTANMRDSMNILDIKGAEALRGRGDSIVRFGDSAQDVRQQTAFITDEQISRLCQYWRDQRKTTL